jgi:hypothetical protein
LIATPNRLPPAAIEAKSASPARRRLALRLLSINDSRQEDLMREWSIAVGIVERVQKEPERLGG